MSEEYVVYGAAGSGAVPVEAALTLIAAALTRSSSAAHLEG